MAKRSYPISEVRGSGRECQAVTAQTQRSGAAKKSHPVSKVRGGPRSQPAFEVGVAAWRRNPMPEARGGGREEEPHVQGAEAAQAQEGLEELSHVGNQEGWR